MRMDTTSRIAIVLWSAVPGLIIGLLIGGGVWVVVQLVGQLVPGAGSLVQRWQRMSRRFRHATHVFWRSRHWFNPSPR